MSDLSVVIVEGGHSRQGNNDCYQLASSVALS